MAKLLSRSQITELKKLLTAAGVAGGIDFSELSTTLQTAIGTIGNVTTTAKTLVGAINEHDAEIGVKSTLTTDDTDTLVAAINEVDANADLLAPQVITVAPARANGVVTIEADIADTDTVTIGSTTYTFKTTLSTPAVVNEVLIGASENEAAANLILAIGAGAQAGTKYATGTTANAEVTALINGSNANQVDLTSKVIGAAANDIELSQVGDGIAVIAFTNGADVAPVGTKIGVLNTTLYINVGTRWLSTSVTAI